MAKWGEGDPRWIVEERPDATNVNNWHWTEKNADNWSKAKIKELFGNLVIEDPKVGNIVIEEVEKCDGEARVNNRKGKLIFFYEWEIALKWKGCVNGNDTEVTGKIEIPNLSEEHEDLDDVDIDVTVTTKGPEANSLKEMARKGEGPRKLRATMAAYIAALRYEYSQGLILPKKGEDAPAATAKKAPSGTNQANLNIANKVKNLDMKKLDIGVKLEVGDLEISENMKCTGQELFNVLTQRDMIQVFTGGEAKMKEEAVAQGDFELLGGNISGMFIEVIPFTKIVQKWRLKSWPSGHFSHVEMVIQQTADDTKITIKQTGIPIKELDNTRMGWHRYYFEAMKRTFGFGATLF